MSGEKGSARGVDSVERALTLLGLLRTRPDGMALAELSRESHYYKSTILRLMVSLERFGYVVRTDDGIFRPGPTALGLGAAYRAQFDLGTAVRSELTKLCDESRETASFYIRDGDHRICLHRVEPPRSIRHTIAEGERLPLERGAAGRVLLAFGPAGTGDHAHGAVRRAGCAVSIGERDPDVAAIAVPVLSTTGELLGALALSGLVSRFGDAHRADLLAALLLSQARLLESIPD